MNDIIQGLREIVEQETDDGFVDGVNQQVISCALAFIQEKTNMMIGRFKKDDVKILIDKLEHGILLCKVTNTSLVHVDLDEAEKIVELLQRII